MPSNMNKKAALGIMLSVIAALMMGCSTTSSTKAKSLKLEQGTGVDLSHYRIATVLPFAPAGEKHIDGSVGAKFADDVRIRLEQDFGPIFTEVRTGSPLGRTDELIVTGQITEYEPGSKFGRAMLIGVGAASFKGNMTLKDGSDQRVLMSAPFDKLWAWGGMLGASKGIEDMTSEASAKVATTVAQAKGWKPPKKN